MSHAHDFNLTVRICGYLQASFLLEREAVRWDALVILDSQSSPTDFVELHARRHLYLRFDDVDRPMEGRRLVTTEQIAQGLDFCTGGGHVLISCRAGQSRSAAMAYLVACKYQGIDEGLKLIDPKRHIPNPLIVRLGAGLLDRPDVWDAFERWRVAHRHISLSDYYDDLEREFEEIVARGGTNRIVEA